MDGNVVQVTSVYSNTFSHPRRPVQQLLPSVSPAPADAAEETPLPWSAAAQHPWYQLGAASAFLCGLPPLRKSCVVASLQRVCFKNFLVWRENQQQKKIHYTKNITFLKWFSLRGDNDENEGSIFLIPFVLLSNWLTDLMSLHRCPNPLDPAPQQTVLFDPRPPSPQGQTRRFTISTFQFRPDGEFKNPDEEVRISRDLWVQCRV